MKVIEKNDGRKIAYELTGTKLDFADGALRLDLARYQRDSIVTKDIMIDSEGCLTTGHGQYYAAQVEIPAMEYDEKIIPAEEPAKTEKSKSVDGESETDLGEASEYGMGGTRETVIRTPLSLDMDKVTLYLFAIDGIIIQ
ncbi:hypothetical protein [uncultured Bacteroides sp.]|uniref:hypothetical protein n=1 Tax=uncultured Bacteroides sp. TaxID=162156 RepID=UPI00259785F0|nr:hypothetical protein [uncultured Bacteroides sp.]